MGDPVQERGHQRQAPSGLSSPSVVFLLGESTAIAGGPGALFDGPPAVTVWNAVGARILESLVPRNDVVQLSNFLRMIALQQLSEKPLWECDGNTIQTRCTLLPCQQKQGMQCFSF